MTDRTEDKIVAFTREIRFSGLHERVVEAARLRIIDSIGVALAANDAPPVAALRSMAPVVPPRQGGRLWVTGQYTTPDHAALTNGTMIRYLDMSDAYFSTSTAHPSDNIAGLIALAENLDLSFEGLLLALIVSYEVQCRFCDVAPFHQNGWDQPIVGAPAAAMGAARLLELNEAEVRAALSLAVTPNLPTYQTRSGQLSMWKNIAGPNGARLGIHAACMAAAGITGPEAPFEGPHGLWNLTLEGPMDIPLPSTVDDHIFAVEQSDIKLFPVRIACQLPVLLALEMRPSVKNRGIRNITVWTDEHSFGVPSKDPALWKPVTRESADHSLPFCLAAAFIDGKVGLDTFLEKRFLDEDIRSMIDRVDIKFDPKFGRSAPTHRACRLVVTDEYKQSHSLERRWSPDDPSRQPNAEVIHQKFIQLVSSCFGEEKASGILDGLVGAAPKTPVSMITELLVFDRELRARRKTAESVWD